MLFCVLGLDLLWVLMGLNHNVEILQSYVFFYFILSSCLLLLLN